MYLIYIFKTKNQYLKIYDIYIQIYISKKIFFL